MVREALSLNSSDKRSSGAVRLKALRAIEHYEVAVQLGHKVMCSTLEKEFVEMKVEICESIYVKLKANLKLYVYSNFLAF